MSEPYIGEIRMFGGNFAPLGWALCNGQIMSIAENETLFMLLGTTYGGDGQTTFGLPDLRGRIPMHISSTHPIGEKAGSETVTLLSNQMPVHTHMVSADAGAATQPGPGNGVWAPAALSIYAAASANATMSPQAISASGGSQPHDNMMPSLAINFIIALEGLYPPQN